MLRIGSFSKILAPGVRLGWLLGPPGLIERLIGSGLRCMGGGANPLMANILAAYCQQGLLEPHIEGLRAVYRERRDAMLAALEAHMPPGVRWTRPGGGFFVWLTLPEPFRAAEVAARAREAKLLIPVGDPFFAEAADRPASAAGVQLCDAGQDREGIETLGQVLKAWELSSPSSHRSCLLSRVTEQGGKDEKPHSQNWLPFLLCFLHYC